MKSYSACKEVSGELCGESVPGLGPIAKLFEMQEGLYPKSSEAVWTGNNMSKKLRGVNGNLKRSIACVMKSPI